AAAECALEVQVEPSRLADDACCCRVKLAVVDRRGSIRARLMTQRPNVTGTDAAKVARRTTTKGNIMSTTLPSIDLSRVFGGRQLSHADHLNNGNGGVVQKLPDPRSHAGQLANGNGGIVPKLPDPRSHAGQLARGNGGIVPKL